MSLLIKTVDAVAAGTLLAASVLLTGQLRRDLSCSIN
jgi:hypothetical protein